MSKDPSTWNQTWQGIEPRRTLWYHWIAVRKVQYYDHFGVVTIREAHTEQGAMRWTREWMQQDRDEAAYHDATGLPPWKSPYQYAVLDMREHPGLRDD